MAIAVLWVVALSACSGPTTFMLTNASVDATYQCPLGAANSSYDLHATIGITNATSSTVSIQAVKAEMILVAVKGTWLEQVGDRYTTNNTSFTPSSFAAGSSGTLDVTIPSACTNGKAPIAGSSYGEYSVTLAVSTSAGTHIIQSHNRHRIIPA